MKSQKGITLISLTVTIVVLLILAAIGGTLIANANDFFKSAQNVIEGSEQVVNSEQQKIDTVVSEIKIGLTVYRRDDTFIAMIVSDMEEAVKEAEQKNNIKIVMNTMDAKGSQIVQNDHIDKLIEQGCDVLCVNLVDRTVAATVIDKAKAADIPVVFFNREPVKEDLERWNKVYYVGADASESGKLEGQIVVEQYNKNNKDRKSTRLNSSHIH